MKEKGILFNGAMVRAIIDGRKTVTRRLIKIQPNVDRIESNQWELVTFCGRNKFYGERIDDRIIKAPYATGDRVYVREAWTHWFFDSESKIQRYWYAADYEGDERPDGWDDGSFCRDSRDRWYPSIHMPKSASRIWMTVASVRPERAKDITEEDARREGFGSRASFLDEWTRIYGEWTACFWVWRIEFKDIRITGKE